MENFTAFEKTGTVPERNTGSIISHAFEMYKGLIGYAILTMILYVVASSLIQAFSGIDQQAVLDHVKSSEGTVDYTEIWKIEGMKEYYGLSALLSFLLGPLWVGLVYMAHKVNNNLKLNFSDLFIGYRQNFLNILIYSFISSIIIGISFMLCVLPALFVAPMLLIGYPVLLFENANAIEALKKTFSVAKENYGTFLGAGLLGALISMSGLLLCFIGVFITAPFIYAVMYSAYVAFVGRPMQIIHNS